VVGADPLEGGWDAGETEAIGWDSPHRQTGVLDRAGQFRHTIAAEVAGIQSFPGPEPPGRGDGDIDASAGDETACERGEEAMLVLDMFEHIEQANGGDGAGQEAGVGERRADHVANTAADGVGGADGSGFTSTVSHPASCRARATKPLPPPMSKTVPGGGNGRAASGMQALGGRNQKEESSMAK
jgi:hypothetical protein